jgi:hypothetical protein
VEKEEAEERKHPELTATQKLQREVDDFEQELADINRVEHTIANLAFTSPLFDGRKPGEKQIFAQTPSFTQEDLKSLHRFHSPQQSRFEAHPPTAAAKPKTMGKPIIPFSSTNRGNDNFGAVPRTLSLELTTQKGPGVFFRPTRMQPEKEYHD